MQGGAVGIDQRRRGGGFVFVHGADIGRIAQVQPAVHLNVDCVVRGRVTVDFDLVDAADRHVGNGDGIGFNAAAVAHPGWAACSPVGGPDVEIRVACCRLHHHRQPIAYGQCTPVEPRLVDGDAIGGGQIVEAELVGEDGDVACIVFGPGLNVVVAAYRRERPTVVAPRLWVADPLAVLHRDPEAVAGVVLIFEEA